MQPVNLKVINQDDFIITENLIGGDLCFLVHPKKQFYQWTRELLPFRSSIWTEDGKPVSLSFKKFFNFDERTDLTYTPFSMTANGGCEVIEKIDGSTLIISKYKGQYILRSRGTFDASMLPNGYELEILKQKYPHLLDPFKASDTSPFSCIYEWVSPSNQIVLPFQEPDIYLTGIVNHIDYSLALQDHLDKFASLIQVKRPKRFSFKTVKEMLEFIPEQRDFEGVCVYCNKGQDIRKLKTSWYLKMHHALTDELGSFERVVELYFNLGMPETYNDFFEAIANFKDHEIATHLRGDISRVVDGMKAVRKTVAFLTDFAKELKATGKSRREMAEIIQQKWGKTNRAGMVFTLLDGKVLDNDSYKKLFYQEIKK
jgi:hypothetical protein